MANEQILIVDDEPDVLELCKRILSGNGYVIYSAGSGQKAIEIARETPLDLAILDYRLPDRDGISVYEAIRTYQPDTVGIIVTGYPSMEVAIEALRKGISGFVLKPFTPAELRQAVSEALTHRRLQRENARLQAMIPLYELSRSLMTTIDLDVLLDQVVELAIRETGADRASLMLEENGELIVVAARGLPQDIMRTARTRVGEGIAGWVAKHGEPLLLDKSVSMPPELEDALRRAEIASAVCAPLIVKDRVIGVLNLTKLEGTDQPFTPSDRDLISVLAGQVAVAIENARLFQEQRAITEKLARVNANLRALQQAATAITSRLSPQRVLQTILDGCAEVMNGATIALGLLDQDRQRIEVHLHHGETKVRETTILQLSDKEIAELETRSGITSVLTERLGALVQSDPQTTKIGVIPLAVGDEPILGAMAVGSTDELTEADIATLAPFADQAAVAISNARLFTQLQHAYEELQEAERQKREAIQAAVQALYQPLNRISTYLELLEKRISPEEKEFLKKIQDAASQLEYQIETLLEKVENRTQHRKTAPTTAAPLPLEHNSAPS